MNDSDQALLEKVRHSGILPEETLRELADRIEEDISLPEVLIDSGAIQAGVLSSLLKEVMTEAKSQSQQFFSPPGTFQIIGTMGAGGAGEVFKAIDCELGRLVALKVLLPEKAASTNLRARFDNEARIGAMLDHPNLCPVFATGFNQDNVPFIAMKRVLGQGLDHVIDDLRTGRRKTIMEFPVARRIDIMIQAAQGVAYAHSKGVIHRDLKPANIMVGNHGEVLVMDWGLAKATDGILALNEDVQDPGANIESSRLDAIPETMDGAVLGTPMYMAPEQAKGDIQRLDHRTDVYALGVTLYELLTLDLPFYAESLPVLLEQIVHEKPTPPHKLDPNIPADLSAICMKCLEKGRVKRYQSVDALLDDLRAFRDGHVVAAIDPSIWIHLSKLVRRNRIASLVAVIAFLILTAATGLFTKNLSSARDQEYESRIEAENMLAQVRALARARVAVQRGLSEETVYGHLKEGLSKGEPDGDFLTDAGGILCDGGFYEKAQPLLKKAIKEYPPAFEALYYLAQVDLVGVDEFRKGLSWVPESSDAFVTLIKRAKETGEENEYTLLAKAIQHIHEHNDKEAIPYLDRALARAKNLHMATFYRGMAKERSHDIQGAINDYMDVCHSGRNILALLGFMQRGNLLFSLGKYDVASSDFSQAILMYNDIPYLYVSRANSYVELKYWKQAKADYSTALKLDPDNTYVFLGRGRFHFRQKHYDEALADWIRASEIDPHNFEAFQNRGLVRFVKGDLKRAIADLQHAIKLDPEQKYPYFYIGNCYLDSGNPVTAIAKYDKLMTGKPHATIYLSRGIARLKAKMYGGAHADFKKAIEQNPTFSKMFLGAPAALKAEGGMPNQALKWKHMLSRAPNTPEIQKIRVLIQNLFNH